MTDTVMYCPDLRTTKDTLSNSLSVLSREGLELSAPAGVASGTESTLSKIMLFPGWISDLLMHKCKGLAINNRIIWKPVQLQSSSWGGMRLLLGVHHRSATLTAKFYFCPLPSTAGSPPGIFYKPCGTLNSSSDSALGNPTSDS